MRSCQSELTNRICFCSFLEPATRSFIPESSQFTPQMNDNDIEFDMLEDVESPNTASAFEESGTKLNKSWNKRGSPTGSGKKECVIS